MEIDKIAKERIEQLERELAEKDDTILSLERELAEKDDTILSKEAELWELRGQLLAYEVFVRKTQQDREYSVSDLPSYH